MSMFVVFAVGEIGVPPPIDTVSTSFSSAPASMPSSFSLSWPLIKPSVYTGVAPVVSAEAIGISKVASVEESAPNKSVALWALPIFVLSIPVPTGTLTVLLEMDKSVPFFCTFSITFSWAPASTFASFSFS